MWNIAIQPAVGWVDIRSSDCSPLGEKWLWNRTIQHQYIQYPVRHYCHQEQDQQQHEWPCSQVPWQYRTLRRHHQQQTPLKSSYQQYQWHSKQVNRLPLENNAQMPAKHQIQSLHNFGKSRVLPLCLEYPTEKYIDQLDIVQRRAARLSRTANTLPRTAMVKDLLVWITADQGATQQAYDALQNYWMICRDSTRMPHITTPPAEIDETSPSSNATNQKWTPLHTHSS